MPRPRGRKAAYLELMPSGIWRARWWDENGKEHRRSTEHSDEELAKEWLADKLRKVRSARRAASGGLTYVKAADRFFAEAKQRKFIKPSTLRRYQVCHKNWKAFFEDVEENPNFLFLEIDGETLKEFIAERRTHTKRGKNDTLIGITDATIRYDLAYLSSLFSYASLWPGGPSLNPVLAFNKRQLGTAERRRRWLRPHEFEALLHACSSDRYRRILIVAVETGMRAAELINLRWYQIDFVRKEIHLDPELDLVSTKTDEPRIVPITPSCAKALLWKIDGDPLPVAETKPTDPVFLTPPQEDEKVRSGFTTFKNWWYPTKERAKITNFRFHDLRHTFASWYLQRGGDKEVLRRILGHETDDMTSRYAHLQTANLHVDIEKVVNAVLPGETTASDFVESFVE